MRVSVETLCAILRLDTETGRLYWRERGLKWFAGAKNPARAMASWNAQFAGREAFTYADRRGYRRGEVFGRSLLAHRVVFAIFHGRLPAAGSEIDHRDGETSNNRPNNLREASHQENMRNQRVRLDGRSQFKGVRWHAQRGKWSAEGVDGSGRRRHLGLFTDEIAAAHAYDDFVLSEHAEFSRPNFPVGKFQRIDRDLARSEER